MRKFDTTGAIPREIPLDGMEEPADKNVKKPDLGCNVELTQVTLAGTVWWTFGFEAFGKSSTVVEDLCAVTRVLAARNPPPLGEPLVASYIAVKK
jgi:hypothetical protein